MTWKFYYRDGNSWLGVIGSFVQIPLVVFAELVTGLRAAAKGSFQHLPKSKTRTLMTSVLGRRLSGLITTGTIGKGLQRIDTPRGRFALRFIWYLWFFVTMWINLAHYIILRNAVSDMAGETLQENSWDSGQVMTLSTWLPTVIDFALVFRGKPLHHTPYAYIHLF